MNEAVKWADGLAPLGPVCGVLAIVKAKALLRAQVKVGFTMGRGKTRHVGIEAALVVLQRSM